jgi:prepilin-type N-terminal cleavage/methylation domain-containing protein
MILAVPRRGFTLIELILVMAVLTTVLAIAAPRLSSFMWGRNLQEEGRRLFALSRYGRSLAVSQSTPMRLWVNPEERSYGLTPNEGYTLEDEKEFLYQLPEGMQFEVSQDALDEKGRGYVSFWPDGTIDELSLTRVIVRGRDQEAVALVQKDLISGYEVVNVNGVISLETSNAKSKRKNSRDR